MMLSSMQFSWIIKQIFKVEPELEPGQSDGSSYSQIPRLQAAPAPALKPWLMLTFLKNLSVTIG